MAFPILAAIPVFGKIIDKVLSVVDKAVPDKDMAVKLKAEIQSQFMQMDHEEVKTLMQEQASIIRAEAAGESPAQRNWRPHLMYLIMGLMVFNGVAVPLVSVIWNVQLPVLEAWDAIPKEMWNLLSIGLGGYIIGRSGEKIVANWKNKQEE